MLFWHYVRTHLTKHELERYLVLRHVNTDEGRGRAWLRSALNEHALERYMHMLVGDPAHISQFYEDTAFLMDQEKSSMLPTMSAGLGSILFAINIDNPDLNPPESSVTVRGLTQSGLADTRPVLAKGLVEGKRKKKRRKPRSNVVSFDDEDDDDYTLDSSHGKEAGTSCQPSSLTPILDLSIGDLIPVCHPAEDGARSEDSIPSYSEDTETAAAALMLAQNVSSLALSAVESPSAAAVEAELSSDMASATPDELKQALLVMTQQIKDVEQENTTLRRMVEQESEMSAKLRADAREAEKQTIERLDKQESRIQTLTRENQLLKHQLKKYIAAVQMLKRDGLAAHEELRNMVGDVEPAIPDAKPHIDHQFEASEYEKKLVQVAEMHGELMEFNERLHRMLLFRECTIRRLREELTDLRGPLPDENQTSDDDLSVTSDYDASVAERISEAADQLVDTFSIPSLGISHMHSTSTK
ncbi:hypothetical protein HPB52_012027 [Rhipicephalus sanguineus]|uniref:RUN domain-containing protein n=1 Tax=Rhipicephalus sanguineus TaxID=34632 RepID=A0A9D4SRE5_RHISA|nr:hypothetical protein HPB52_012027 [Rhipicephalus sanguineus]